MGNDDPALHAATNGSSARRPRTISTARPYGTPPLAPNIREKKARPADTLVISLGSHAFRYGLAVESTPRKLPAVVAFPRKKEKESQWPLSAPQGKPIRPIWAAAPTPDADNDKDDDDLFEKAKNDVVQILDMDSRRIGGGRPIPWDVEVEVVTDHKQTPQQTAPPADKIVVGKEACMLLRDSSKSIEYDIVAPIWDGKLIFGATAASDNLVRAGLDELFRHIARQVKNAHTNGTAPVANGTTASNGTVNVNANGKMDDTDTDVVMANGDDKSKHTSDDENDEGTVYARRHIALVIPDTSDRRDVVEMMDAIFRVPELSAAAVFIHQGSVSCALGAGLATCTVLDIGHSSTTISCIEDGLVLADSRVHLHFGAHQMLAVFKRLLMNTEQFKNTVEKALSNNNDVYGYDVDHIATRACEQVCSFKTEENDRLFLGTVSTPDNAATFRVKIGLALRTLPAQGLLHPDLLLVATPLQSALPRRPFAARHVTEDYFLELLYSPIKRNMGATAALPIGTFANVERKDLPASASVVDAVIWAVINAAKASTVATTTTARFLSAIVLSGGGTALDGIAQTLEKLIKRAATAEKIDVNEVTVIDGGKGKNDDELAAAHAILDKKKNRNSLNNPDMDKYKGADEMDDSDTASLPWKGGAVMVEADAVKDYWVYKDDWAGRDIKVLRERVPFYW